MKELERIAFFLREQQKNSTMIYNYTIPQVWDMFGYDKGQRMSNHEMIVDPYDFTAFALEAIAKQCKQKKHIEKEKRKGGGWIKKEVIYDLDMKTLSSWDHDRNERIEHQNLYGCSDSGTYLKTILLLPLLQRAGVTTLLLHRLWELDEKRGEHDVSDPHAYKHPLQLDPSLCDPMLKEYDAASQLKLLIDTAHALGFHVLFDGSYARLGRNNELLYDHPEWFYWIKKEAEARYHAPEVAGLPKGCIPSKKVCKVLHQEAQTKQHLENFTFDPKTQDSAMFATLSKDASILKQIEAAYHITTAPLFSDQINSDYPLQTETTYYRFYLDQPLQKVPYVLQDTLRPDLFPGKQPNQELWDFLTDCLASFLTNFSFDGFVLQEHWHLPRALIKQMIQAARKQHPHCAILLTETKEEQAKSWQRLGVDLLYGSSAYQYHNSQNSAYHDFAYARKSAASFVLAASEFRDTPRITQYEGGETLAKMRMFLNLFLPNVVPYLESGQLSLEVQPQYLSPFADQSYQNALPAHDLRSHKQACLDHFYYAYTRSDYHTVLNQLEKFSAIRNQYLPALCKPDTCIPVWFDDPRDPGIGFTYPLNDSALLVVCNGDIEQERDLTIHTENMFWELPFQWGAIHQRYSSHDPYVHELTIDSFQNIPMHFAPGEVKLIEITKDQDRKKDM